MMRIVFASLAVAGGIAAATQAASNAGLKAQVGLGPALLINTTIVLIGTIALWLGLGAKTTFFPPGAAWTLYLGGFYGFVILAALALAFPKLGAAWAVAMMVLGQGAAALLIDHHGLMGMPKEPITVARLAGIAMVAGGILVMRL
jgi:transporter family-2 protein